MNFDKIKSHAKINVALNITGKTNFFHKIESVISFISLHDEIFIRENEDYPRIGRLRYLAEQKIFLKNCSCNE